MNTNSNYDILHRIELIHRCPPYNKTALFDNCSQLEVIEHGPDTLGIKMAAKYKYLVSNERRHHDLDILILI